MMLMTSTIFIKNVRSCGVSIRLRVLLRRIVVGISDWIFDNSNYQHYIHSLCSDNLLNDFNDDNDNDWNNNDDNNG